PFGVKVSSDETPAPETTFTVSPAPSRIAPPMRVPGRKVSMSVFDVLKLIAVPPVPMIAPEFTRVDEAPARMPVAPGKVTELLTFAVAALMAKIPPEMVAELLRFAVAALMPMFPPEMVPELLTFAMLRAWMPVAPPVTVPELLTLALVVALMPTWVRP